MQILNEKGKTYLKGMMSKADTVNRNGRIYPKDILKEATLELAKSIKESDTWSELEHPPYIEVKYNDNVCGRLVEVTWDDKVSASFCKLEILEDTKAGKEVLEAIQDKRHIGISTRGSGSLVENKQGVGVVQDDLKFYTADTILGVQSCQSCILQLHESTETYYFDDMLVESCSCNQVLEQLSEDDIKVVQDKLVEGFKNIFKKGK